MAIFRRYEMAPAGSYKETKKKTFFRWRWCWCMGIDSISNYTGYPLGDVSDFVHNWVDFPAIKTADGIWVAKKRALRKWIKERNPPKTEIPEARIIKVPKIKWRKW